MTEPHNDPEDIIRDISLLYELALSTGRSLDLWTNCDLFVRTLMSRMNFAYCGIWLRKDLFPPYKDDSSAVLAYANPEFRVGEREITMDHILFTMIDDGQPISVSSGEKTFDSLVMEKGIRSGTYIIDRLGDIGVIKTFSFHRETPYSSQEINKFRDINRKFTVSLEGCLAHQRLDWEIRQRIDAQKELEDAFNRLEEKVKERTYHLYEANLALEKEIRERHKYETAISTANQKLNLLSQITRHDILNQMTAAMGYLELIKIECDEEARSRYIEEMEKALVKMRFQIEFTRDYQNLGIREPGWQNVHAVIDHVISSFPDSNLEFIVDVEDMKLYADPMLEKVFYNLVDNSIRHGEQVSRIRFSVEEMEDSVNIVYEDNGAGIPEDLKERIFDKGFGKQTGYGMFLVREILAITGIDIHETGEPGSGVLFEIRAPPEACRWK